MNSRSLLEQGNVNPTHQYIDLQSLKYHLDQAKIAASHMPPNNGHNYQCHDSAELAYFNYTSPTDFLDFDGLQNSFTQLSTPSPDKFQHSPEVRPMTHADALNQLVASAKLEHPQFCEFSNDDQTNSIQSCTGVTDSGHGLGEHVYATPTSNVGFPSGNSPNGALNNAPQLRTMEQRPIATAVGAKSRARLPPNTVRQFEQVFVEHPNPSATIIAQLSQTWNEDPMRIKTWFNNRRAKERRLSHNLHLGPLPPRWPANHCPNTTSPGTQYWSTPGFRSESAPCTPDVPETAFTNILTTKSGVPFSVHDIPEHPTAEQFLAMRERISELERCLAVLQRYCQPDALSTPNKRHASEDSVNGSPSPTLHQSSAASTVSTLVNPASSPSSYVSSYTSRVVASAAAAAAAAKVFRQNLPVPLPFPDSLLPVIAMANVTGTKTGATPGGNLSLCNQEIDQLRLKNIYRRLSEDASKLVYPEFEAHTDIKNCTEVVVKENMSQNEFTTFFKLDQTSISEREDYFQLSKSCIESEKLVKEITCPKEICDIFSEESQESPIYGKIVCQPLEGLTDNIGGDITVQSVVGEMPLIISRITVTYCKAQQLCTCIFQLVPAPVSSKNGTGNGDFPYNIQMSDTTLLSTEASPTSSHSESILHELGVASRSSPMHLYLSQDSNGVVQHLERRFSTSGLINPNLTSYAGFKDASGSSPGDHRNTKMETGICRTPRENDGLMEILIPSVADATKETYNPTKRSRYVGGMLETKDTLSYHVS